LYRTVEKWIDIALERAFVLRHSLGNPKWVVERTASVGGIVYHDVTEPSGRGRRSTAASRLIAVNNVPRHAGPKSPEVLLDELRPFGLP